MGLQAQSPGAVGGQYGIALGAATEEADRRKALDIASKRQQSEASETAMRMALQQEELSTKLGAPNAAAQLSALMGQGPAMPQLGPGQQGPAVDPMHVPQGIMDGSIGSADPQRAMGENNALEQFRQAQFAQALPLLEKLPPEDRPMFINEMTMRHKIAAIQLHNNQQAASIHDNTVNGVYDPTDPETGQRVPDETVRAQMLQLSERARHGDLQAVPLADKARELAQQQHVTTNQRVARGNAARAQLDERAAKGQPVSDYSYALADGVKRGVVDTKTFDQEWPAALAGVPGPAAINSMRENDRQQLAQASITVAQSRLENAQTRNELLQVKAEADKNNLAVKQQLADSTAALNQAKADYQKQITDLAAQGLRPTAERPGQNKIDTATIQKQRAAAVTEAQKDPRWASAETLKARKAIVDEYVAHQTGEYPEEPVAATPVAQPDATDTGAGFFQQMLGLAPGKTTEQSTRNAFLKQWRAQNPKGTVDEARAAWDKSKK